MQQSSQRSIPFPTLITLSLVGLSLACQSIVSAPPPPADEESVKPGINDSFLAEDVSPQRYQGIFEVESREIFAQRKGILAAMQLEPGEEIADLGTGTGLFLEGMAQGVGQAGHVYAVDISKGMLDFVRERIAKEGLKPVEPVLCDERSTGLAKECVDLIFVCDTYHHFEYPRHTLYSMWQALRPGGRLIVIDFERIPGVTIEWLMKHVRADKATFKGEIEAAGFHFEEEVDVPGLEENYMLVFSK